MKVKIIRFKKGYKATLGELYINDEFFCFTLEREWLDNKRCVSCIPAGEYSCKPYSSPKIKGVIKYKNVTQVTNVPNRSKVLVHAGNYYLDTLGCILVGDSYKEKVKARGEDTAAVYKSKKTLKRFFDKVGREFELEIIDNINLKPKKKMAFPLLFLAAPLIKKLAIKGFDKLKGKVLDKAKETVINKILEKTGIDLGDHLDDYEKQGKINEAMNNLSPEQLLELKKEIIESESELLKAELENQTEQMSIVNQTMRAEMQSDDKYLKRSRPTNIYCFAFSMTIFFVSFAFISVVAVLKNNADMVENIVKLCFALLGIVSAWAAIVGVNINSRGKEKIERLKQFIK